MKYMGSKRAMLANGLGKLLSSEAKQCRRAVDLFCGGAAVSWYLAETTEKPVLAVDLQEYATALADAVIGRETALAVEEIDKMWLGEVDRFRRATIRWEKGIALDRAAINTATWAHRARELCGERRLPHAPIWSSYGGHYFSPTQAITFDAMLKALPQDGEIRSTCLAATVIAASKCAASPGHTAQPFQPTRTAAKFLREAWLRDPIATARTALQMLCPKYARKKGEAVVADAVEVASTLTADDLVFVDPPYSGVHYSRFYHVLETIARGKCGRIEGVGRYPPAKERPVSSFSRKGESAAALNQLLEALGNAGCKVVLTFPQGACSNGLSGRMVEELAKAWFKVEKRSVKTKFSTLGGNNSDRKARKVSRELILVMRPK